MRVSPVRRVLRHSPNSVATFAALYIAGNTLRVQVNDLRIVCVGTLMVGVHLIGVVVGGGGGGRGMIQMGSHQG